MAKVTLKTLEAMEFLGGTQAQIVTRGFYQSIFDLVLKHNEIKVCDAVTGKMVTDWKAAIRSIIHESAVDADLDVIRHAVIYFTGNPDCKVEVFQTHYIRITTAGYRAGPCG